MILDTLTGSSCKCIAAVVCSVVDPRAVDYNDLPIIRLAMEHLVDHSTDSSAARPADDSHNGKGRDKSVLEVISTKDAPSTNSCKSAATSLCLFGRLPLDMWRKLVGLLSYSDVAACACSTSHDDTKRLLIGYMRRRCCISTFKRLLAEYGAITTDHSAFTVMEYAQHWDADFFNIPEERKYFWRRATEIIFMCEPKLLLHGKHYRRYPALVQQDYIHSCGVLFASKAQVKWHRRLQRKFRAACKAPISAMPRFRLLNVSPNIA